MNTHFSEHDDEAQLPLDPAKNVPETDEALAPTCEATSGWSPLEIQPAAIRARWRNDAGRTEEARPRSASAGGQARRRRPREDGIIELRVPARNEESARPLIGAEC